MSLMFFPIRVKRNLRWPYRGWLAEPLSAVRNRAPADHLPNARVSFRVREAEVGVRFYVFGLLAGDGAGGGG